jgi:hypothetical protein
MKKIILCLAMILFISGSFANDSSNSFPIDVKKFIANAESCIHFAGEVGYDKERQEEINQAINKYCRLAKKERAFLKKKYGKKEFIQIELDKYKDVDSVLDN